MPYDEFPVIPVTGPQGPRGLQGPAGAASNGTPAFTTTTAAFTMPAAGATVAVDVVNNTWIAIGQYLFIETAGYFKVVTLVGSDNVILLNLEAPDNAAESTAISSGVKVVPGGYNSLEEGAFATLGTRVTTLENTVIFEGDGRLTKTFLSATEPSGLGETEGDVWWDTNDRNHTYVYQSGAWVSVKAIIDLATETIGQIDGTKIEDEAISASKIAANTITAAQVVASNFISNSAMIANGIILDAHIQSLRAAAIAAGDLAAVNISHTGKLYHTAALGVYFDSVNQDTQVNTSFTFEVNPSAFSAGGSFPMPLPVEFYGPSHASAAANPEKIICPNPDGEIKFQFHGALTGYDGTLVTVFYRKNQTGNYVPLASRASGNGVSLATIHGSRKLNGWTPSDMIEIFIAPCAGDGTIAVEKTCSSELDVMAFNW